MAATALLATLLIAGAAFLPACAPDADNTLRGSLAQKLDGIKALDGGFIEELKADTDADLFSAYGLDGTEFMRAYLDGFDYSIDSIAIDGDTATATVTLTCKSFSGFQQKLTEGREALLADEELAAQGNDAVNARYRQLIMDSLAATPLAPTQPFTLTYQLEGDTWTPVNAVEHEISSALLTN